MEKMKHLTIRIPQKLYQVYIEKAVAKAQKEKRIITITEVIKETLEKNK